MKTADRICAVLLILASIAMIYETSQMEELAYQILSNKMFPYITFIFVIVLALGMIVATFVPTVTVPLPTGYWRRIVGRRRMITLGLFCLYLLLMPVVGFLPASAGFIIITVAVLSPQLRRDIPVAVAITAGVIGIIYLVFVYWLQVFLP
jgi:hypothetical protein